MSQAQGSVFSQVDHEVFLVTANHEGAASGMVVTWVLPASMQPGYPRLLFLAAEANYTFELLRSSGRFVIHLLAEGQVGLMERFGLESGRDFDKFANISYEESIKGDRILTGCLGFAVCEVSQIVALPERQIVIADVTDQAIDPAVKPLTKKLAFSSMPPFLQSKFHEKQKLVAALSLDK